MALKISVIDVIAIFLTKKLVHRFSSWSTVLSACVRCGISKHYKCVPYGRNIDTHGTHDTQTHENCFLLQNLPILISLI